MKLAIKNPDTNAWELRWTWMPMWISMNRALLVKVQHELDERVKALDPALSPKDLQGWVNEIAIEVLFEASGRNRLLRKILNRMNDISDEDE